MTARMAARRRQVTIAIVGKYVKLHDAYLSIIESLNHAGFDTGAAVTLRWIDSEAVTDQTIDTLLGGADGIIVPGGFGDRGVEGKVLACKYARERSVPFLGICLGLQIAVIEYARHVCGLADAHSGECSEAAAHRVIDLMPEQAGRQNNGGTMRLGAYPCKVAPHTLLHTLYAADEVRERHRHRFEVNNDYRALLLEKGLCFCGTSPDGTLVEAIELPSHPFYIGVQFHPEFLSRPNRPHPLFIGLLRAACKEN